MKLWLPSGVLLLSAQAKCVRTSFDLETISALRTGNLAGVPWRNHTNVKESDCVVLVFAYCWHLGDNVLNSISTKSKHFGRQNCLWAHKTYNGHLAETIDVVRRRWEMDSNEWVVFPVLPVKTKGCCLTAQETGNQDPVIVWKSLKTFEESLLLFP